MSSRYLKLWEELKKEPIKAANRNSRVLIVDGLNTFIRSYAASPVTNDNGLHVGGISGTILSIGHAIKTVDATRVVVVFDGKNGTKKRRDLFPEYKASRKFKIRLNRSEELEEGEESQKRQLLRLVEYLEHMPIDVVTIEGAEADDVIAYMVQEVFQEQCYIMSSDKDFLQLINERVQVWSPTKKKLYYASDVLDEYGITPQNFVLHRAVTGDASDNIPGVDGVGLKTLLKLYPNLGGDERLSVKQIIEEAKQQPKSKKYMAIAESESILERNLMLMSLRDVDISPLKKLSIISQLDKTNRLSKMKLQSLLFQDQMSGVIRNFDVWVKETLYKLDMFLLSK
jgi:DNA polymerase-1